MSGWGLSWKFLLSESALLSSRTLLLLHTVGQLQQECELMRSQGRLMKGGADVLRAEIKSVLSVQIKSNHGSECGWLHISYVSIVSYRRCHYLTPLWAILESNFAKNLSETSFSQTGALFVALKKSHFDTKVDLIGAGGLQKGSFLHVCSYSAGGRCQRRVRNHGNIRMLHPETNLTTQWKKH